MCDFCHAPAASTHHPACPIDGRVPEPVEPVRDPVDDEPADLRLAIRTARRAVAHVAEVDRVVASIRRDMMRP